MIIDDELRCMLKHEVNWIQGAGNGDKCDIKPSGFSYMECLLWFAASGI